ncbi:hypothetical protein [Demequina sediminicola]|uniref:hypothetical protein n=1 Tax=Demequina sediminicola TaxID=1095026 RepID=UPI000783B190|nr:hypothetical protein [Demequina sediminicola]
MHKLNPHHVRLQAREREYPNATAERDALKEIDREVFDRVRVFEKLAVQGATDLKAVVQERINASLTVIEQLRTEIAAPLSNGEPLTSVSALDLVSRQQIQGKERDVKTIIGYT